MDGARQALREHLDALEAEVTRIRSALELLGDEPAPIARRDLKPAKARKTRAAKPAKARHHAPRESRAAVLEALSAEWVKPGDLFAQAGVTKAQGIAMLRRLGEEGVAEWNGERTKSSRWRLVSTRKATKTTRRAPAPVEDDDGIESDGPFADEDDDS